MTGSTRIAAATYQPGCTGDIENLAELRRGLLLMLRQRLRDPVLAEDICQEAFRRLIERLKEEPLDDPARVAAYLAQTARNMAIAGWRRSASRKTLTGEQEVIAAHLDAAPDAGSQVQNRQRADAVRTVLKELRTPRDRDLLIRYYLLDEDKLRICESLGLSEAHFNRVIFRARERFRVLLEARYAVTDLFCLAL